MPVRVRYYTDPACARSWGAEPVVRRMMWEFGNELSFAWVMGGLAREYPADAAHVAERMAEWLEVTAQTGMPTDPRVWRQAPIASTYPACQAVKAAAEQGPDAAYAYLRRLREGLIVERRKLDHPDALIAEAGTAGLEVERFRIDLTSNAIVEAFAADLDEARTIAGRREGVRFPSAVFVGESGERIAVWGARQYGALREGAITAGAQSRGAGAPEPLEVIERFGRVATREVEELTERPRPVVEAELWSLAREWRVAAHPVLGGTMWEPA